MRRVLLGALFLLVPGVLQAQTTVQITWSDTVNTSQTGYQVSRRIRQSSGALSDWGTLPGTIAPSARAYTDSAPIAGTRNCYAVTTLSAQGSSAMSQPDACVEVPAAGSLPQPVTSVAVTVAVTTTTPGPTGTGPLQCDAHVREGGRVDLQCVPR